MKKIDEIKHILKSHKEIMAEKYHVKEISVFGSYVRGDQVSGSDIDILVEFSKPVGLIKFIELEEYLSELLKTKVDLVPKSGIKIALKDSILSEAVSV
ncbi:MAG: nucleotidyltransferase family protein [Candidatus Thermoplasmatota archaeon]|nr:nucleotidyltransferase family protein [Candidatus Thermoplasmatota archaeon]